MISPWYSSLSAKTQLLGKNTWLQLQFHYGKRATHRMEDCNWNCELTQFLWKKRWLQVFVQENTVPLKILNHCKRPPEINTLSRTLTIQKEKNISFNDSPSKLMKNSFYFIIKVLFVLKIFKFLSWFFGHAEKTAWLERC